MSHYIDSHYNFITGIVTVAALWANTLGDLNKFLTVVISCLSIILLTLKIIEKMPMLIEKLQGYKDRFKKKDNDTTNNPTDNS